MRISDWSSDVCSSDLYAARGRRARPSDGLRALQQTSAPRSSAALKEANPCPSSARRSRQAGRRSCGYAMTYALKKSLPEHQSLDIGRFLPPNSAFTASLMARRRLEEHKSELKSQKRISQTFFLIQ